MAVVAMLLAGLSLPSVGCDRELAAQVASLSGAYIGDVVAVAATRFLQTVWGVENANAGHVYEDDEHSHERDVEPLHEHDH